MKIRLRREAAVAIIKANMRYAVVVHKDVSVIIAGAVIAVMRSEADAKNLCESLCEMYREPNSHIVFDLTSLTGEFIG